MSACVFPGSFDPPTRGHLDIIRRAAKMFDEVTVAVMINRAKQGAIPIEERVALLKKACKGLRNVQVHAWEGLLADYMCHRPGAVAVRGVRNAAEFEQEQTAYLVNKAIYPAFETVFLAADQALSSVSSSAVREIASFGGDVRPFIPEEIQDAVCEWLHG